MATQEAQDEPELVELHFELEIDYRHAFEENEIITRCIAEVMKIPKQDVFFDGVDEIMKDNQFCGLFRGHIPTTKHEIEKLVSIFYNSLQTQELQQKIVEYSGIDNPQLEIRELYETDQNEEETFNETDQYDMGGNNNNQQMQQNNNMVSPTNGMNINMNMNGGLDAIDGQQLQMHDPYGNINDNPTQQKEQQILRRDQHDQRDIDELQYKQQESRDLNSMESMLEDLKDLLESFITDTTSQFDQLLENCQKQMNEDF
eukprot:CAMPEP_0201566588 /NCGR_PEP_ID=MMETSP0190_2-20130828/6456_1 /ASSEMBLY_ACC=CAM_ASM_000263 /TAXON_ID=37353 /ORGANISM="Rosalina sp." /LENGTH=257 /DNA_ID=CAMNT_0047985489 /DNA_START=27 /DNA_END=800 /DNA_ORIENTATION=-